MKTGLELITVEHRRQATHRNSLVNHKKEGMIMMVEGLLHQNGEGYIGLFPAEFDDEEAERIIGLPIVERLIIAGALLAAEIDRLQSL